MVQLPKHKLPVALLLAHFEKVNERNYAPTEPSKSLPTPVYISALIFVILCTFTSCFWERL